MRMTSRRARAAANGLRAGSRRQPGSLVAVAVLVCAGVMSISSAALSAPALDGASPAATRVHWGRAEHLAGLAALNKGDNAAVTAISCWGAGGCAAGGFYTDGHGISQAFVVLERKDRWAKAEQAPGTAALNQGGNARVNSVSCARTSVCVAVGTYVDREGNQQWFTLTERGGRWGSASQVPDPALTDAVTSTVWCAAGGLCAAGGSFTDPSTGPQAWVMTETAGHWQPALEVPGIAALNAGGNGAGAKVGVDAISCASAGNCAAGGQYASSAHTSSNGFPPLQPFVVDETNGTWGTAQEVPGIEVYNNTYWADGDVTLITCPTAGNCTAAGSYQDAAFEYSGCEPQCQRVFVVSERNGKWVQVDPAWPGSPSSLVCPAAGDCVVTGTYIDRQDRYVGVVMGETNSRWAGSRLIAGTQSVSSVSCAKAGYCAAGGTTGSCAGCLGSPTSAYVISEWHGTWGKAVTPAGIPARYRPRGLGFAAVSAVACPPKVTLCVAGGTETPDTSSGAQAFVVSQQN